MDQPSINDIRIPGASYEPLYRVLGLAAVLTCWLPIYFIDFGEHNPLTIGLSLSPFLYGFGSLGAYLVWKKVSQRAIDLPLSKAHLLIIADYIGDCGVEKNIIDKYRRTNSNKSLTYGDLSIIKPAIIEAVVNAKLDSFGLSDW